ncbi:hypothetical protein Anas_02247 [Armadillidium nasatum]|uniref:Uncharacterized protein n=1 Tax=Armadillidium nasatum TaxID=96803 RepID=A0A5N5TG60_9CRUS|nr:hypothetical protein Anas_02247 [Armadillidium nasatum]
MFFQFYISLLKDNAAVHGHLKRWGWGVWGVLNEQSILLAERNTFAGSIYEERGECIYDILGFPQTQKGSKGGYDVDGGHPLPEWAFAQDDDNSLVYEEGVLVSGSLGALNIFFQNL